MCRHSIFRMVSKSIASFVLMIITVTTVFTAVGEACGRRSRCCKPWNVQQAECNSANRTDLLICSGQTVQDGWVIVADSVTADGACPNGRWRITSLPSQSGSELIICAGQPVPPGWVIVNGIPIQLGCANGGWRIKKT